MARTPSPDRRLAGPQVRALPRGRRTGLLPSFLQPPLSTSQLIASSFLGLIAVGTLLLWLPASHGDTTIGLLDAAFTATSAVCVTGLIVVDTGTAWSTFGQGVIAALIQLGGLGSGPASSFTARETPIRWRATAR